MRFRILALSLACLVTNASAQGPQMAVRGTQTILAIDTAEITIHASGGIAETGMLLTFRNDTNRPVEGEFSLPLPPGATISNYALEVNGALREAVAVEKERALHAYETIKSQMIDPGIVERQAGNVYRTRVFPVPANGTKQLRIGYVETLREKSGSYIYECPLDFLPAPASVTLKIHTPAGVLPTWRGTSGIIFTSQRDQPDVHICKLENIALRGTLEITETLPADSVLHAKPGDEPLFLWSGRFPEIPETPRPAPKRVRLFLDTSDASIDADHATTLDLLDAWFAAIGDLEVELQFLRDRATEGGLHRVTNGAWPTLRDAIKNADREGSHSLLELTDIGAEVDLVVYCGSGRATAGPRIGQVTKPLIVIHPGHGSPAPALADASRRTGGAVVAVDQMERSTALKKLMHEPFRVISINGRADVFHLIGEGDPAPGDLVRLIGHWPEGPLPALGISFGVGDNIQTQVTAPPSQSSHDPAILHRLHAQQTLAALEAAPVPDTRAILEHCRTHNLASDTTSLIVLERFSDHVRYEIPPPEPELLAQYEAAIRRKQSTEPQIADVWQRHASRHNRPHPGEEVLLLPRIRQVAIWKNAVTSVFDPEEIDSNAFSTIVDWQDRALALIERRKELQTAAAHAAWRADIDAHDAAGSELAATPIQPPPPGNPVAISVRGIVRNPGVFRAETDVTLLGAIQHAGGPLLEPTPHYVALYRNAGKTLYNVRSDEFEDVPLLPADMVVLEGKYRTKYHEFDFFAAPSSPRDQSAIARQQDVWVSHTPSGLAPFGSDPLPMGGRLPSNPDTTVKIHDPSSAEPPDMKDFAHQLATGADPHTAYRELKGSHRYPVRFHIDAARLLARHGHSDLAATVLSTLVSRGGGHLPSRLAEAFWLAEFGLHDIAVARLAERTDADSSPLLAYARATLATEGTVAERHFHRANDLGDEIGLQLIARNDIQGHSAQARRNHLGNQSALRADLRITVQSTDISQRPAITVLDPLGDVVSWRQPSNRTGGHLIATPGLAEFTIRNAIPGTYTLSVKPAAEATLRVTIHTDWGHRDHQLRYQTHFLPPTDDPIVLDTIEWKFR